MRRLCIITSALLLAGCQAASEGSTPYPYGHQDPKGGGNLASRQPYPQAADFPALTISSRSADTPGRASSKQRSSTANSGSRLYSSSVSRTSLSSRSGKQAVIGHEQEDLWLHLAEQMQLPIPADHPRVVAQRKWFLKHPEHMRSVAERAKPFLYLIKEEIEKRDMPMELVLLPIVESTFDPRAYSGSHAAGLWQMLRGTGKHFGLQYDNWYDGRYDVMAATNAALDYLTYLNKFFDGNWAHSLAAYNAGEGRVQRAIRANRRQGKSTDFWALSLPKETQNYVPKMMALADILKHPDHYGLDIPAIPNRPQLKVVQVEGQVDLNMAADLAGVNRQQMKHLNPAFKRSATSPTLTANLLVPVKNAQGLELAMADLPQQDRKEFNRYQVKPGDSLGLIAKLHNTSVDALKRSNNLRSSNIRIGQTLMLPRAGSRVAAPTDGLYKVRSGDSLHAIASRFSVSIADLLRWNQLRKHEYLRPGQQLIVASNAG